MKPSDRYVNQRSPVSGSFAQVTTCENKQTGATVALKQLLKKHRDNADYVRRFRKEISFLERLAPHDNIVPMLDKYIGEDGDWYVMPRAAHNLGEFLDRYNQTLSMDARTAIFEAVVSAMLHAHSKDILHRDLAPTNILLFSEDGETYDIKVADFGLGRDLKSLSGHTRSGQDGYGHLYFTAPEQIEDLRNASVQSDIYSLGKVLNYVCTGRIPRIYHPCDYGPVIRKATEEEPSSRYGSVDEMLRAYEEIKELLGRAGEETLDETIRAYAQGTRTVDWQMFHRFAVAGDYADHVFYDYLAPVAEVLSSQEAVDNYVGVVGSAVQEFVAVYLSRIRACLKTFRWPFKETDNFGWVLYWLFRSSSDADVKVECFSGLWSLAYESDQWAVQDFVCRIFDQSLLPPDRYVEIAHIILSSKARLSDEKVRKLSGPAVPKLVKQAIRDLVRA